MANSLTTNPIILDTFSSNIDIGNTLFNDSLSPFYIYSIEWEAPVTAGDAAIVRDGLGTPIFNESCVVAGASVFKQFYGAPVRGLKVMANEVTSGRISIHLV